MQSCLQHLVGTHICVPTCNSLQSCTAGVVLLCHTVLGNVVPDPVVLGELCIGRGITTGAVQAPPPVHALFSMGGQGPPARWRVMRLQGLTSKHAAHVHLMPPFLNLLHAHSMRSKPVRPCRSLQCILAGATSRQIGPKAPTSGRTTTSAQHTQTRHQLHVISQCGDRLVVMGSISPQRKCVALWVKCMLVGDEITELYIKRQPMDNTVPRHNSRRNEFAQYS